jgi:hypothetical protein
MTILIGHFKVSISHCLDACNQTILDESIHTPSFLGQNVLA